MSGPILALRAAILSACGSDPALLSLFGGALRLHDEPPRGAAPVYALFGRAAARDVSGVGGRLVVHEAEIVVWSRPGSTATGLAVVERMAALLDGTAPSAPGARIVSIAVRETGAARDEETGSGRAWLVLRAAVEPI